MDFIKLLLNHLGCCNQKKNHLGCFVIG